MISAILPVMRNGLTEYILSIGIPTDKFAEILENAPPGPRLGVVVLDHSDNLIARSEPSKLVVGRRPTTEFLSQISGSEGAFDAANRMGEHFRGLYRRSESTGLLVAVGMRTAFFNATVQSNLADTVAAGTVVFAFAMGLTFLVGGRFEKRFGTLGIDRKPTREEFALLFDSAPNGVVLVDEKGIALLANVQLRKMFGYAQEDLIGQPIEILVPDTMRSSHIKHRRDFFHHPVARPMGGESTLLGQRKDGSEFPIEVGLCPIEIRAKQHTMATVIDITERSRAAESLSNAIAERDRLRRHLMRSAEDERLRLSHELHDQTGQALIAASLAAKNIEQFLDADGRQRLTKLDALLDQIGRTLHQVAWELRPASIDELGLAATLDNYTSDWSEQTGIAAEFYCKARNIDQLPDETRTTIYRVIQEGLTNIAKHARKSKRVSVVINQIGTMLQLTIEDDGNGFDLAEKLSAPSKYGSLGIPNMRERLSLIGGTLEMKSTKDIGTTVFARIPIGTEEARHER